MTYFHHFEVTCHTGEWLLRHLCRSTQHLGGSILSIDPTRHTRVEIKRHLEFREIIRYQAFVLYSSYCLVIDFM